MPTRERAIKRAAQTTATDRKEIRRRKRVKLYRLVEAYKRRNPCRLCGETHPDKLTFHHRNPAEKSNNIARMIASCATVTALRREMAKCDVLCTRCHVDTHNHKG